MSAIPLVRFENASYSIAGHRLLSNVNFTVYRDQITVVLGANGAGKTLLLKLCHGLGRLSSGSCTWFDVSGAVSSPPRQTMAFQQPILLRRTCLDNVMLALHDVPKEERRMRALEALDWSELFSRANQMAQTLSVGQQQRLALSRARSRRPEVLFLDEPTAALDPSVSDRIESLLKELAAEGTQIMMTTHNLAQAERLADMILFMVDGTIDAQQDKVTFFNEPGSQAARQFINRESMHSVIARGE